MPTGRDQTYIYGIGNSPDTDELPRVDRTLRLDQNLRQCPGRSGNIHSVHLLYTDEAGPQWHQRSLIIQDWG